MRDERDRAHGSKTRHVPISVGIALRSLLLRVAYDWGSLLGYALIFPSSYSAVIWPPNTILLVALFLPLPRRGASPTSHRWSGPGPPNPRQEG
jgi:hypothetical protein